MKDISTAPNIKKIALFIGFAFGQLLITYAPLIAFGENAVLLGKSADYLVRVSAPAVAAIIVQGYLYKQPIEESLGISFKPNWWFALAWVLPFIINSAVLMVNLLLPWSADVSGLGFHDRLLDSLSVFMREGKADLEDYTTASLISALMASAIWSFLLFGPYRMLFAFGEELGWRGFLHRELSGIGFWRSSFLIGVVWGVFNMPAVLQGQGYPQHRFEGVFMMIVLSVLLSPILSYIRIVAKSVVAAAIFHGSLNASVWLSVLLFSGANDLVFGLGGVAGIIVLVMANGLILARERSKGKKSVLLRLNKESSGRSRRNWERKRRAP